MARVECDQCGGYGHCGSDGEGGYYSCYRCGETGWMIVEPEPEPPDADPPFDPAYADREAARWLGDRLR